MIYLGIPFYNATTVKKSAKEVILKVIGEMNVLPPSHFRQNFRRLPSASPQVHRMRLPNWAQEFEVLMMCAFQFHKNERGSRLVALSCLAAQEEKPSPDEKLNHLFELDLENCPDCGLRRCICQEVWGDGDELWEEEG